MLKIGRNRNTNDEAVVTTVEVNDTTATILLAANDNRIGVVINLNGGTADEEIYIRYFAAAVNNNKQGIIIKRKIIGATSINDATWEMTGDNIYTGEVSAISEEGTFNVHITEY